LFLLAVVACGGGIEVEGDKASQPLPVWGAPGTDSGWTPTPAPAEVQPERCAFYQDFVQLVFEDPIRTCLAGGHLWDFKSKTCSLIPFATSFSCSWSGLQASPAGEYAASVLANNKTQGFNLIGCGELGQGDLIIFQFIEDQRAALETKACAYDPEMLIHVSCFRLFSSEAEVNEWAGLGQEEQVKRCFAAASGG